MLYKSYGIPCSHIVCVMRLKHVNLFPESLICKRWLKDTKNTFISCFELENKDNEMMIMAHFGVLVAPFNRLYHIFSKKHNMFNFNWEEILKFTNLLGLQSLISELPRDDTGDPNAVKTKGASQKKNYKKNKKFSIYNKIGYSKTTCPILLFMDDDLSDSDKKIWCNA